MRVGYSHHCHGVIIENGRDIFGREFIRGVGDEQASLAYSTVTDNDTPIDRRKKKGQNVS